MQNVYAAGEIMAGNILRKGYIAGIGMTIGTVFGRIAGKRRCEPCTIARMSATLPGAPVPPGDRMKDALRSYDRLLAGLSRRELLNITWKLGLAAALQPVASRAVLAQPLFTAYPFTLGVASGDPLPDGVVLWTRLAPDPLDGGGMPMARVEVAWEIAHDRAFTKVAGKGQLWRGRSWGTASTSKPAVSSRAANISIASAAAAK